MVHGIGDGAGALKDLGRGESLLVEALRTDIVGFHGAVEVRMRRTWWSLQHAGVNPTLSSGL